MIEEKLTELCKLTKETIACCPVLQIKKDGTFQMKLEQGNTKRPVFFDPVRNIEICLDEVIRHIKENRREVTHNDIRGNSSNATFTLNKAILTF